MFCLPCLLQCTVLQFVNNIYYSVLYLSLFTMFITVYYNIICLKYVLQCTVLQFVINIYYSVLHFGLFTICITVFCTTVCLQYLVQCTVLQLRTASVPLGSGSVPGLASHALHCAGSQCRRFLLSGHPGHLNHA